MHTTTLDSWRHEHTFGQDESRPGESRTRLVLLLTSTMMVVEIAAGIAFGSMALLADGLHMGSHTAALGISAFAYAYARRHAADSTFSFGTGKVNALGGFTGAILLVCFALIMAWESIQRMVHPQAIQFNQAIFVAAVGLAVNAVCAVILDAGHGHDHHHDHDHGHEHAHAHDHEHTDHNLRSAYLHVIADALTSVLAIVALLAGKYLGWMWVDPAMGIVGAILVTRWSLSLMRTTSGVLLDHQAPDHTLRTIREAIETDDDRIADLHVWSLGPGILGAMVSVVTHEPKTAKQVKEAIAEHVDIAHLTVEVHYCTDDVAAHRTHTTHSHA